MPDELTEPGRATPARASSFLIENLLAAEAKGSRRAAQGGGGGREDEEEDDDDPEDEDAEQLRRRRLQRRRQLRAGAGPTGEARARALLGPGALGLGPRPPPGPGPPYALGCGGATRWYPRAHGGYGGGLSPDSEWGRRERWAGRDCARGLWVRRRPFWATLLLACSGAGLEVRSPGQSPHKASASPVGGLCESQRGWRACGEEPGTGDDGPLKQSEGRGLEKDWERRRAGRGWEKREGWRKKERDVRREEKRRPDTSPVGDGEQTGR